LSKIKLTKKNKDNRKVTESHFVEKGGIVRVAFVVVAAEREIDGALVETRLTRAKAGEADDLRCLLWLIRNVPGVTVSPDGTLGFMVHVGSQRVSDITMIIGFCLGKLGFDTERVREIMRHFRLQILPGKTSEWETNVS
jgi:hypothetical protein